VAATLHNLAAVLAARGHYLEAERQYQRALAIKEKVLGAESLDVALTRNSFGMLLTDLGRPAEAVPLLEPAVAILEGCLGPSHPHLSAARENLRNAIRSPIHPGPRGVQDADETNLRPQWFGVKASL